MARKTAAAIRKAKRKADKVKRKARLAAMLELPEPALLEKLQTLRADCIGLTRWMEGQDNRLRTRIDKSSDEDSQCVVVTIRDNIADLADLYAEATRLTYRPRPPGAAAKFIGDAARRYDFIAGFSGAITQDLNQQGFPCLIAHYGPKPSDKLPNDSLYTFGEMDAALKAQGSSLAESVKRVIGPCDCPCCYPTSKPEPAQALPAGEQSAHP